GPVDLSVQVRVLRDGKPVVAAPARKLTPDATADLARIPFTGAVTLGQLPRGSTRSRSASPTTSRRRAPRNASASRFCRSGRARHLHADLLPVPQPPRLEPVLVRLILQRPDGLGDVLVKLLQQLCGIRRRERLETPGGEIQLVQRQGWDDQTRKLRDVPRQTP